MCVYGDLVYPLRINLQASFIGPNITNQMELFNTKMSASRVSAEWLFGDIINYFKFLDFKKNLKMGMNIVGIMYILCAILRNALACLYSNQTVDHFSLQPPSFENYFSD